MTHWLAPIARALDVRSGPLDIFFRDDDAGWANEQLFELLDLFAQQRWPIDLAAIPAAVRDPLAAALLTRVHAGSPIGLHQHGFMHLNHEPEGRPWEFGPSRPAAAQQRDIAAGSRALREYFGAFLDPIFTPPWNRCTPATALCVRECGLTAISRDRSADPLNVEGLSDCSIGVDWFARAKGKRLTRHEWAVRMAQEIADVPTPLGVMLHHAQMDRDEFRALGELMTTCTTSIHVRGVLMRDVVAATTARIGGMS
jgi:hypothetical protein